MLLIECPNCGPRNSLEFSYQGLVKPRPQGDPTKAEWRKYLYQQDNPHGFADERWFHANGCRRFLDIRRHTQSNEIESVSRVGPKR